MNIFLSSASSRLGSYITKKLLDLQFEVYGSYRTNLDKLGSYRNKENFHPVKQNHTYSSLISPLEKEFDVLINSTGVLGSDIYNIEDILSANIKAAAFINLQSKKQIKKPQVIINFSSISVYGDLRIPYINNSIKPSPKDLYGTTKLISEQILNEVISINIPIINIRFPAILGNGFSSGWLPNLRENIIKDKKIELFNSNSFFSACTTPKSIFKFILNLINKIPNPGNYICPVGAIPDLRIIDIFELLVDKYNYKKNPLKIKSDYPCCFIDSSEATLLGYEIPKTSECINYWLSKY